MVSILENNTFLSNNAFIEGGAIKFNTQTPYFSNNIFINNTAEYGGNIAAFPCKIVLKAYNKTKSIFNDDKGALLYDSSDSDYNDQFFMRNISSGYEIPFILEFNIMDQYNQIVTLDQ